MLFHLRQTIPKVKTVPIHKKHIIGSNMYDLYTYYDKNFAFIYDKRNHRLIANFENIVVVMLNYNGNENELLFSLACKPEWNENKNVNYAMITSESTIQKIREICNNLYKLSSNDTNQKPTILADKQVFAYAMKYTKFVYYKLVKATQESKWEKDGEIELYNRSDKRKAKYEQFQEYVNKRYYVIGDQTVNSEGIRANKYYIVYDELRIYDLYKRKIIEITSTRGTMVSRYRDHEAFHGIGALHNGLFVIKDEVIVRPVVVVDEDGVIAKIRVDIPDDNGNEETIEIGINQDLNSYEPIILFFSHTNSIVITKQTIFVYDLTQSSYNPSEKHDLVRLKGAINTGRVKLYKYKNFLILIDKYHIIAVYYNKKDSRYYFKNVVSSNGDLDEFGIIGYVLSRYDNNDCIGMLIASQKHKIMIIIYDINKREIYFSDRINYNYIAASKKYIDSLSRVFSAQDMSSKFILRLLSGSKLLDNVMNIIQKDGLNYLNVVVGKDVKVIKIGNGSSLPLSPADFYCFSFFNYILTYEQPCLVRFARHL